MNKDEREPENAASEKEEPKEGKGGDAPGKSGRPETTKRSSSGKPCRSAMGEYIVADGGHPLTHQADPSPGPSDYHPNMTPCSRSTPRYSIVGRHKLVKENVTPGPDNYDTSRDLKWTDKTHSLKEKGKTHPYDVRLDAHLTCSIGAAGYLVQYWDTGRHASRSSIGSRHLRGINAGPPNYKVQPADTHGFNTPGPDYRPNSPYWGRGTQKSFGLKLINDDPFTPGPGPGGYNYNELKQGVSYSFGSHLDPPICFETPGPGTYDITSTIGTATAKSIARKATDIDSNFVPSPNTYYNQSTMKSPQYSMTYRAFEREIEDKHPSPAQYSPRKVALKETPKYSCRKNCRPCYPDILNYPKLSRTQTPAPGMHSINRDFNKNHKPAYSIGKRLKEPENKVPGPNHYQFQLQSRPDSRKAPEYSMAKRLERPKSSCLEGPGPSAYLPYHKPSTPSYSMSARTTTKTASTAPGANAYNMATGQTHRGKFTGQVATLKTRASPFVYSGFANIAKLSSMV